MSELTPVRANIAGISWCQRLALCALAGGPMKLLRGEFVDCEGKTHWHKTIGALVRLKLCTRSQNPDGCKIVRLTDRGRWFAATALGEMADVLALAGGWKHVSTPSLDHPLRFANTINTISHEPEIEHS